MTAKLTDDQRRVLLMAASYVMDFDSPLVLPAGDAATLTEAMAVLRRKENGCAGRDCGETAQGMYHCGVCCDLGRAEGE